MEKPKKDTLKKVLYAALSRSSTSRTAISNDTGLSYVTVDRAVEFLLSQNILKQSYSAKSSVIERRSRMLSTKLHHWIAVYEICPRSFSFYIVDIGLRIHKSFTYTPEDSIFIDDLLRDFQERCLRFTKKQVKAENCIGSVVLSFGSYDEGTDKITGSPIYHLPAIRIKDFFSRNAFGTVPTVYCLHEAFSAALKSKLSEGEAAYSLFFDRSGLLSSYVTPGGAIHINDLGSFKNSSNVSFSRVVKRIPDPDLLFDDLAKILYTLMNSVHITKFTVCDSLYCRADTVCAVIKNSLTRLSGDDIKIPDVIPMDMDTEAVKYISREIRDRWIFEKILTDKG